MIRFYNGLVLRPEGVTKDEVWVDEDRIVYVGPEKPEEERPAFTQRINLQGDLLMPGFKDAHTHSAMTFLRSMADDLPLQDWLFQQVFPREAKLTPERTAAFVKVAFLEYLANGITACFDMYYHTDEIARISNEWGFRTVLCEALSADSEYDRIYRANERYNHGDFGPFVSYQLGFHAEYTASLDMLEYVSKAAHELQMPVWSHNSETRSEVDQCIERYGVTPTKLFEQMGLYDFGGGGYHCVYMTDEDIDIFRRHGLYAVLNPCSNAKLASGIAPLRRFMDAGVNLAIGTDGPASNNALDMFREMYLANVLAKLDQKDAAAGNPEKILYAATGAGALAMGLTDCDCVAEGKQADLIVIDMHRANMRPVHNVVKNLVYSGNPGNVLMTMIAGKILYCNGEYSVGEDPNRIYAEAERLTAELMAEV